MVGAVGILERTDIKVHAVEQPLHGAVGGGVVQDVVGQVQHRIVAHHLPAVHRRGVEEGWLCCGLSEGVADMDGEDGMVQVGMWCGVEDGVNLAEGGEGVLEVLQQLGIDLVGRVLVPAQHFLQRGGHMVAADIFSDCVIA